MGISYYTKIAKKSKVISIPNYRSSHKRPTVLGGGLLFAPSFFALLLIFSPNYWLAGLGAIIGAVISYLDDIKPLPIGIRLPIHVISVILILLSI